MVKKAWNVLQRDEWWCELEKYQSMGRLLYEWRRASNDEEDICAYSNAIKGWCLGWRLIGCFTVGVEGVCFCSVSSSSCNTFWHKADCPWYRLQTAFTNEAESFPSSQPTHSPLCWHQNSSFILIVQLIVSLVPGRTRLIDSEKSWLPSPLVTHLLITFQSKPRVFAQLRPLFGISYWSSDMHSTNKNHIGSDWRCGYRRDGPRMLG